MRPIARNLASATALLSATLTAFSAGALPREGDVVPVAPMEDADGRVIDLGASPGKPVLVVYEDRDSSNQNRALKEDLSKLARTDEYASRVALAAVADVSAWDFQPAKHFVREAIRDESRKQGTTIYCDWTGSIRKAYRLRKGVSNVVLIGRDRRVRFAADGPLDADQRARLIERLKEEVLGR